ncbi:MAG TPA: polyprenyl diphosphate synthase [Patescibacteria group bacterium]|nr:polyprenyl diphosphate synthase [Patescibacteria group bacterium]
MAVKLNLPKDTVVPNHLAIIPDGNRRWARARGLHTFQGHKKGFDMALELCRTARNWGIHTVTLWGFSTENWDRTMEEIGYLMKLYEKLVDNYLKEAREDDVKIVHLGRKDRLPKSLLAKLAKAEEETKDNKSYIMNIAIDYGGHDDIIRAVQKMITDKVAAEKVDKELFESYLDTRGQPYPYVDLMIRTSGEQRTSGMLLWQSSYTEYYFENDHFPDFGPKKLKEAVLDFSRRRRRFGGNDTEEHLNFNPEIAARLELSWWRLKNIPEGMRIRDYAMKHLKEQFGLSKSLAVEAAKLLIEALVQEKDSKFEAAKGKMKKFYELVKGELKLAFEPEIVASLEVKMNRELAEIDTVEGSSDAEETAKELYAEVYRISLFQAAKAAHLRVMAAVERNLAEKGLGEEHWAKAEDYLHKYYTALKERVA